MKTCNKHAYINGLGVAVCLVALAPLPSFALADGNAPAGTEASAGVSPDAGIEVDAAATEAAVEAPSDTARQFARAEGHDAFIDGIRGALMAQVTHMAEFMSAMVGPDDRSQVDDFVEGSRALLDERLNDQAFFDSAVARYDEAFTDQEMQEILAFYESEIGKKYRTVNDTIGAELIVGVQPEIDAVKEEIEQMQEQAMSQVAIQGTPLGKLQTLIQDKLSEKMQTAESSGVSQPQQ